MSPLTPNGFRPKFSPIAVMPRPQKFTSLFSGLSIRMATRPPMMLRMLSITPGGLRRLQTSASPSILFVVISRSCKRPASMWSFLPATAVRPRRPASVRPTIRKGWRSEVSARIMLSVPLVLVVRAPAAAASTTIWRSMSTRNSWHRGSWWRWLIPLICLSWDTPPSPAPLSLRRRCPGRWRCYEVRFRHFLTSRLKVTVCGWKRDYSPPPPIWGRLAPIKATAGDWSICRPLMPDSPALATACRRRPSCLPHRMMLSGYLRR